MATGNVILQANVTGGGDGSWSLGPDAGTRVVPTAVQSEQQLSLVIGANTVTIPSGVTELILIPPNRQYPIPNPSYSGTLTLKGVTGDTGVPISNTWQTRIPWDANGAPATIVITATATGTMQIRTL